MKVLVTGGAGYIGSATVRALEQAGHEPVVLDSLVTGPRAFVGERPFYEGDVADRDLLVRVVTDHPDLAATVHMAARVDVTESVARPALYYRENVAKALELFDHLVELGHPRVVFSSSASVYAPVEGFEVVEDSPVAPSSPYARTKLMTEQVIEDLARATDLRALVLRYFNPIGSGPGLETGVHARRPSHVLGRLTMAALGQSEAFSITGTDLPTRDGTGLRDYVHVWDLAEAHVAAVEQFDAALQEAGSPSMVVNLGTGAGTTVRELVSAFETVFGRAVPTLEAPARPGDAVGAFAAVDKAARVLGWSASLSLADGIDSALRWTRRRREILGYD